MTARAAKPVPCIARHRDKGEQAPILAGPQGNDLCGTAGKRRIHLDRQQVVHQGALRIDQGRRCDLLRDGINRQQQGQHDDGKARQHLDLGESGRDYR